MLVAIFLFLLCVLFFILCVFFNRRWRLGGCKDFNLDLFFGVCSFMCLFLFYEQIIFLAEISIVCEGFDCEDIKR